MRVLQSALIIGCLLGLSIVLVPSWRHGVNQYFTPSQPQVLTILKNDFFNDGRTIVFAKIKSGQNLFIEVYEEVTDGLQQPLARILLPDAADGYFHYRGQATSLALEDINSDGRAEILAPTFDANHVAHLNVYTYNSATKQFEPLPANAFKN